MSAKEMKSLLAQLGEAAAQRITRPAEPHTLMHAFCDAMSERRDRPVRLILSAFPAGLEVSGARLDCGDHSVIIVEERATPTAQLVILGHELWHEEKDDRGHHLTGGTPRAVARTHGAYRTTEDLQQALDRILSEHRVTRDALLAIAARARSHEETEQAAETFGLLFGRAVRSWMTGPHAQGPVNAATVEGRISLSLTSRNRQIL
ncbi:toxin [Streptomyces sp. GXMU-J15]|uniref:Toxin n=1 Tax=Streptomyces fuscus TaxID=3048495 RepID=A0ABT7J3Z6_9ACTN|nr:MULTISPECIES: toxin [Streptomyces]MDL2079049.1 toxin [Streptomyces fuscus]